MHFDSIKSTVTLQMFLLLLYLPLKISYINAESKPTPVQRLTAMSSVKSCIFLRNNVAKRLINH